MHIAFEDAVAYAQWVAKRLPTEAEWEFAARGGLSRMLFPWGDDFRAQGQWTANTHQGHFPDHDTGADHHNGIAPVGRFAPNGYGLHDVAGNVWNGSAIGIDRITTRNSRRQGVSREIPPVRPHPWIRMNPESVSV